MYAIIETGGKQYRVSPDEEVKIEKLKGKGVGEEVEFDRVLLVNGEEGTEIGHPYLEEGVVEGEIVEEDKEDKVTVFTYKKRKGQRRKLGHRQPYMKVRINSVSS